MRPEVGPIDTVHYNAAVLHLTSIDSLDAAGFARDLSVNIGGAYATIRPVLPPMRALALGLFADLKQRGIHLATVTVCAHIEAGSKAAADVVDAAFELRSQPQDRWTAEKTFTL